MDSGFYGYYESIKNSITEFLSNIEQEGDETKEAFHLLVRSVTTDTELTADEKQKIGEQLKDVFKTIGVVGLTALPGASLVFILTTYFKLNKYILPSSFQEKKD